jgi:membrane fusion protein
MADRRDQDAAFLDLDPPHWAARGLAYFIITIFALMILALLVVHVPEVVSGRFALIPTQGTDPVRAPRDGVVSEVTSVEGGRVRADSMLFLLRSPSMADRSAEQRTLQTNLKADEGRLAIATSQLETRRRADEAEGHRLADQVTYLDRLVASKNRRLALTRELADSASSGARTGSVGRVEASRLELEVVTLAEEVQGAENDRDEAKAAIKRLEQDAAARELEFQETKRGLMESMETERIRIASLEADLVNSTDKGMVVRAPCAGTVLRLRVGAPGAVVREGEILSELACEGDRLQAELILPQAGVPLVQAGQQVKLRFDAFPYQRYGIRFGTVRWLGPSGVTSKDSGAFRALVDVTDQAFRVRGQMQPLLPGMGGQGDILVGRRSLVSYAFEPIRALKENFAEPPR